MAKQKLPPTLLELQPHQSTNISILLVIAVDYQILRFPPLAVPPGATVTLVGNNGTVVNGSLAYAGRYPDALSATTGVLIPSSFSPQDAVTFPVENLSEIWITGRIGNGVCARITGSPVS